MPPIKNYQQALAYLGNKKERPYAHNTRIENMGHDVIVAKYHGNIVASFYPEWNTYSSAGWKTSTTKERINWFLPEGFTLYQENSIWRIVKHGTSFNYVFADGITIDHNGNVYNDAPGGEDERIKKTIKTIKKYVDGYVKALLSGNVPAPDSGDCWYCLMVTDEGTSLGDATGNTGHIESHFEESYYVPSMLVNAEKANHRMCIMTKDGIARLWQGESISEWQASIIVRDVKSSLTAYLKHALNIAQ